VQANPEDGEVPVQVLQKNVCGRREGGAYRNAEATTPQTAEKRLTLHAIEPKGI
jgi:hypothetical protein